MNAVLPALARGEQRFKMPVSSSSKIAVVTGASAGIGAVYADRLAQRGYDLILVARRVAQLKVLAEKVAAAHGRKIEVLGGDLAREADLARVAGVLSSIPDIGMLVNNAGIARLAPFAEAPVQDFLTQIALNIAALPRLTHAALAGFDKGETVTWPSVTDVTLWEKFDAARSDLFAATQTGKPAPRYAIP